MKAAGDKTPLILWPGGLLIVAVLVWQFFDLSAHHAEHQAEHLRRGETLLKAFEAVAFRECRGGRYDPETLPGAIEATRADLEAEWVAILKEDKEAIAEAGTKPAELPKLLSFERSFEPLRPRHAGKRQGFGMRFRMRELPESGLSLVLVLPPDELQAKLNDDTRRASITTLALIMAISGFVGLSWFRVRSQQLRNHREVDRAKIRNLEYLRRLGAGLVHETKNPLGVVRGFAERIVRESLDPKKLKQSAEAILGETDRTVARLDEFLLLSRPAQLRTEVFQVRALFEELAVLVDPDLSQLGASLEIKTGDETLTADREQLRRLFMNLLLNSVAALGTGGKISMTAELVGGILRLTVVDDGDGVPEDMQDSIFEPYVSGRTGGTGLGLSIAQRIAMDHGFELSYEANQPRGVRMILEAPCP